jgi:hypothetical protein
MALGGAATAQAAVSFTAPQPAPVAGLDLVDSDAPTGPHDILLFGEAADAPELIVELDGQELLFPRVGVPAAPVEERITLRNPGPLPVTVGQPAVEGSAAFTADGSLCAGSPLEEGEQCDLVVRFDPPAPGMHRGQLVIHSDAAFAPHYVFLVGTGSGSLLDFSGLTPRFGRVSPGGSVQRQVRLANRGPDPATVSLQITGPDAGAFRVYESPCPSSLPAGSSCLIGVEFAPARAGPHSARLEATAPSAPAAAFFDLVAGATPPRGPVFFPPPVDLGPGLASALERSARAWRGRARRVLLRRGFAAIFATPEPGTLRLQLRRRGRLVARGAAQAASRRAVVRARATRFGRR